MDHGRIYASHGRPLIPAWPKVRPLDDAERAHFKSRCTSGRWGVQVVAHSSIVPDVENLLDTLHATGVRVDRSFGSSDIAAARSRAATRWLDDPGPTETILWIDSDTQLDPISCLRLLAAAEETRGLVTGVSPSRSIARLLPVLADPESVYVLGGWRAPLVPILFAGFGCVAHPIAVLRQLADRGLAPITNHGWRAFFVPMLVRPTDDEDDQPWQYLAEDWSFWWRAREIGTPCSMAPEHRVVHWSSLPVSWEDALWPPRPVHEKIMLAPEPRDE